jgi:two-component system sensor histidine kinase LytS
VESYLAIERERFEARLTTSIDVPAELRALPVLPLLVQPLVENAVKHGISPLRRGGTVSVSASLDAVRDGGGTGRLLRIVVADTGVGIDQLTLGGMATDQGVGLRSIEQRLALHYGPGAGLEIAGAPGLGTRAELRVPVAPAALSRNVARAVGAVPDHATGTRAAS